jgi:hypothetical protein
MVKPILASLCAALLLGASASAGSVSDMRALQIQMQQMQMEAAKAAGVASLAPKTIKAKFHVAGAALGTGTRAIVLRNEKGAVLTMQGWQTGLMANADLSGLAISLK